MVLTNLPTFNETRQPTESILGYVFNGLVASEAERAQTEVTKAEGEAFEAWIATLLKLVADQEREVPAVRTAVSDSGPRESKPPLEKLAAGPWRSLGGYFDYSHWADRERFLELDKAIALARESRDGDGDFELI